MGERLREFRTLKDMSQEDIAKKLNISPSHVANLESGRKKFTTRLINDLIREFNISKSWIENGEGDMFNKSNEIILDDEMKEMLELYNNLDDDMKDTIKRFIKLSLQEKDRD